MAWEKSGVPGARTRTSWFDRDLPAMWRTLENQQSDDHWRLVAGWRKAAELTAIHLRRLEHYRTNLVEAWPPDRNAAAAAYVSRLDFLIQNVRTTHDVAAANYSTLAATVGALAAARNDLKPLYDEYMTKAKALTAHRELTAFNATAEGATVIGPAPVTPNDLERLNNRARAIMYTLSHTLVEAEAAIRQPPTYGSRPQQDEGDPDVYRQDRSAKDARQTAETRSAVTRAGTFSTTPTATPRTRPIGSATTPGQQPSDFPRGTNASRSGNSDAPEPTAGARREGGNVRSRSTGEARSTHLPVGGVIGVPSRIDPMSPAPARRINPIGGVIGGIGIDSNPGLVPPTMLNASGARATDRKGRPINHRSADTIWTTPEGVPPIITPRQKDGPFDPGPVIGLNQ